MNSLDDEVAKVVAFPTGDAAIPVRNGSATIRPDTADPKALEIGRIFRRGTAAQFETGKLLLVRKAELKHGEFLPWLEKNRDVLGFDRRTAQRLMKLASENASLDDAFVSQMDADEIREINRDLWGNKKRARREERDFYRTPTDCVRLAAPLMDRKVQWWEPCAGDGAISRAYKDRIVLASDIQPMASGIRKLDVLNCERPRSVRAIVTNPPFSIAYEILDRALFEWKMPALLLIRIEPLSTVKRAKYTDYLQTMHIVQNLIRFEAGEDGRIVNGNGLMRCAWCLFQPTTVSHTVTNWVSHEPLS